jgi:hypothetical protein
MAMAKALDIKNANEPDKPETFEEKVARLTAQLSERVESEGIALVNADRRYEYAWCPGSEDKSAATQAFRARLISTGWERDTEGAQFAGLPGGEVWRIPKPVFEILAKQKMDRANKTALRANVNPASMCVRAVTGADGTQQYFVG